MAPFLAHLVIGERVWPELGRLQFGDGCYGTFLFGCLAPDVDKFCAGLDQGTTHFAPKDSRNSHLWRRSQRFLDDPADYLQAPFRALESTAQAFVLGYLCHVATDEITARHALVVKAQIAAASKPLPHMDAVLTVMEPKFWSMAIAPQAMTRALELATIPSVFTFAPFACLEAMHRIVLPQVREGGGMLPYLNTMRRRRSWMRHACVSDRADDPELEAELAAYRRRMEQDLPASEQLVASMALEALVTEAADHSRRCVEALLIQEKIW